MTYFVGVDPASASFMASISTAPDEADFTAGPRRFDNTSEGFETFEKWLTSTEGLPQEGLSQEGLSQSEVLICVENTGVYSEALCYELEKAGFDLVLLDPYAVWKAFDDDRKSDELDSQKIAEYGYRYRDKLDLWTPHEAHRRTGQNASLDA